MIIINKGYYAVTRSGQDDELKHFKYLYKEKKNGKWVYYYKGDFDKKDNVKEGYAKVEGKPGSKYGSYVHNSGGRKLTVNVMKGNRLLTKSRTFTFKNGDKVKVEKVGLAKQGYDSAKKKIKKFGKKSVKSLNKQIDRGQKWLNGLFD